jgi:hypothetical protein
MTYSTITTCALPDTPAAVLARITPQMSLGCIWSARVTARGSGHLMRALWIRRLIELLEAGSAESLTNLGIIAEAASSRYFVSD